MEDVPRDRREVELRWRKKVQRARLRLDFTRHFAEELRRDLSSGAGASLDRDDAYRRAIQAETAALAEYARVLQIFTDLIHRDKIPEDPPPQNQDGVLLAIEEEIRRRETAELQGAPDRDQH